MVRKHTRHHAKCGCHKAKKHHKSGAGQFKVGGAHFSWGKGII